MHIFTVAPVGSPSGVSVVEAINNVNMTKAEFTQLVARDRIRFGLWSEAANLAIKDGRTDLYVQHWVEQYDDPGSRPTVERMLGPELTEFIKQQSDKGMNENKGN